MAENSGDEKAKRAAAGAVSNYKDFDKQGKKKNVAEGCKPDKKQEGKESRGAEGPKFKSEKEVAVELILEVSEHENLELDGDIFREDGQRSVKGGKANHGKVEGQGRGAVKGDNHVKHGKQDKYGGARPKDKGETGGEILPPPAKLDLADDDSFEETKRRLLLEVEEEERRRKRRDRQAELDVLQRRRDDLRKVNREEERQQDRQWRYDEGNSKYELNKEQRLRDWVNESRRVYDHYESHRIVASDPGYNKYDRNAEFRRPNLSIVEKLVAESKQEKFCRERPKSTKRVGDGGRDGERGSKEQGWGPKSSSPVRPATESSSIERDGDGGESSITHFSRISTISHLSRSVSQRGTGSIAGSKGSKGSVKNEKNKVSQSQRVKPLQVKSQVSKIQEEEGKQKVLKSGIAEKPSVGVNKVVKYPHMSLSKRYVHKNLTFEQLTFPLLVAGEVRSILRCEEQEEIRGRLTVLERTAYWEAGSTNWNRVRSMFAAVLRAVEDDESSWRDPLSGYDGAIDIDYDLIINGKGKGGKKIEKTGEQKEEEPWFCARFNKSGGCTEEDKHKLNFKGKIKTARHICAKCWKENKVKNPHSELAEECLLRDR